MRFSLQNLFRAILLLTLSLAPGRLTAQESPGTQPPAAATEQPPAVPELADLIPLATALSGRLASLKKFITGGVDLSRVEQQLGDLTKMTLLVSALGVGIGFGLQTIVNNFVCELILLFERPLRVGDTIDSTGSG